MRPEYSIILWGRPWNGHANCQTPHILLQVYGRAKTWPWLSSSQQVLFPTKCRVHVLAYFRDSSNQWFLPNQNAWRIFLLLLPKFFKHLVSNPFFSLEKLRGCVSVSPPQLFLTLICSQDTSWFYLKHYIDSVRIRESLQKTRTRLWQMDRFGVSCNKTNQNTIPFFKDHILPW